jgi:hypothetical protein
MPIARGSDDSQGPDLAAVILSEAIAGTIAAQKTFYSLDRHREHMLSKPVEPDLGIWAVHGFVNERTVEQPGESGFTHIMRFGCLTGYGGSHQPVTRGEYDYHDFPVTYGVGSVAPINFQGMSGGGLWQVRLQRDAQGNLGQAPLLRGSVFYQRSKTETETSVVCHGTASLYRIAYEAIRDAKS